MTKPAFCISNKIKAQMSYAATKDLISAFVFATYEGCQKSSWTPMIKASNEPDFDIH